MLRGLVERAGVADGHDPVLVLRARPADLFVFQDPQRHLHVQRDLNPRSHNLAVALHGVAIAEEEQRTGFEHRKVNRRPACESSIVHVAAVLGRRRGRNRLAAFGRDAEATDHRFERQHELPEF